MNHSDIEHMAQGYPPSHIGKDHEEVVIELAERVLSLQQQLDAVVAEIARRDAIFIPVYPDADLMNRLTDVFHDTTKIHCDEDGVYVDNPELVIKAIINHFMQSSSSNCLAAENMALCKFIRESCFGYNGDGSDISDSYTPADESPHFPSCPATEKVINWFKADGVEMFAKESAALRKSHFENGDREMAISADHRAMLAYTFADELRADAAKGGGDDH